MGPGQAAGRDQGIKALISIPGRTDTGAWGNNRCNDGVDIREHHRVGREGRDDKRGVQRDSRNRPREHARVGQTTAHGTGRENDNRYRHRREQARGRRVRSTLAQLPL